MGIAAAAVLGVPLDTAEAAGAGKSDECLSGPKGAPPQGERWYYRVERGTKRHCWYTRADTGSPRKAAEKPAQPAIAAKADEAPPPPLQPAVANARAEAEQWPPPAQAAPEAPRDLPPADEVRTTMAERWLERTEPVQATTTPPPVRIMQLQTAAGPPAAVENSVVQRFFDALGGALAILGIGTVLIALLRRRKPPDDDFSLPPLAGPDGRPLATWYEPPMDRLRMARHLADLPRPAI